MTTVCLAASAEQVVHIRVHRLHEVKERFDVVHDVVDLQQPTIVYPLVEQGIEQLRLIEATQREVWYFVPF